jgi:hypothetical protein
MGGEKQEDKIVSQPAYPQQAVLTASRIIRFE